MAQYQRFLSYLFEYEGDQKKENCGFAKIEIRGDVQRIFLSVKNNEQAEILHVFGFYHTKDGCDCVPLGRMVVKNGKGQLQYINNGVYLAGSEIKFEQLSGIVAGRQKPFSNAYATVWDDQYFGLSLFEKDRAKQTAQSEDEQVLENQPQEELQTMEVCCETDSKETNKIEQGQDKADAVWAQLSTAYQHIETLPGDTVVCLKVMPADIGRLPRPNWMLSNNGFLMYSAVIDGDYMRETCEDAILNGRIPNIPYLLGCCSGDGRMGDGEPQDGPFYQSMALFCKVLQSQGKRGYLYLFDRNMPGDDAGAFHAADLWYVFGTLKHSWRPFDRKDEELSERMIDAWAEFFKTGKPDHENWPAYTKEMTFTKKWNVE